MEEICGECICWECPQKPEFCGGCCDLCGYVPITQCNMLEQIQREHDEKARDIDAGINWT